MIPPVLRVLAAAAAVLLVVAACTGEAPSPTGAASPAAGTAMPPSPVASVALPSDLTFPPLPTASAGASAEPSAAAQTPAAVTFPEPTTGAPAGRSAYRNVRPAFVIELPEGWQPAPPPAPEVLFRAISEAEGRVLVAYEESERTQLPFDEYWQTLLADRIADDPDSVEVVELASGRAARATLTVADQGTVAQYFFEPRDGIALSLTFSAAGTETPAIWQEIADSFRPGEPEPQE